MQPIVYSFEIEKVGLKDIGDFKNVVSEIRCFFKGQSGTVVKDRYYLRLIPTENLNPQTFIPVEELDEDILLDWLQKTLDEKELEQMKLSMQEQLYPPVRFVDMEFFKKKDVDSDTLK